MYEYSSKFLNDIQKVTKSFQEITNNNIVFTSVTGAVVDCNTLLFDSNVSLEYLRKLGFKKYYIFPLVIDFSLSGFFILDTSRLEAETVKLCGKYIETSCEQFITDSPKQILILDAIEVSKLNSLTKTFHGILGISDETNSNGLVPPPLLKLAILIQPKLPQMTLKKI
ncbi:hypothetical protein [Limosilactobacillus walteri]|uniref:hypothetical protein n=1 Tax=Limosilactobacillus walteri TaxID=2268022 RepID=UPI001CD8FD45|nr:hypothetical protein [Limosilactobacillus walteri]